MVESATAIATVLANAVFHRSWPCLTASYVTIEPALLRSLHEGADTIEVPLDRHLVKKNPEEEEEDDSELKRRRLTRNRREALSLYRDILRALRFFTWPDARGMPWREVLRQNARREFEEARFERDPEVVTRLFIGGREAVQKALDKLVEASKKSIAAEEQQLRDGRR